LVLHAVPPEPERLWIERTVAPEPVASVAVAAEPEPAVDAPEPEPVYVPRGAIEELLCSKPWDCGTIIRIARCESNFRPDAVGAGSYGLLQVYAPVWAGFFQGFWETWMNPAANVEMAWVIYQRAGYSFRPWSCF
jgi:hypothetical protein